MLILCVLHDNKFSFKHKRPHQPPFLLHHTPLVYIVYADYIIIICSCSSRVTTETKRKKYKWHEWLPYHHHHHHRYSPASRDNAHAKCIGTSNAWILHHNNRHLLGSNRSKQARCFKIKMAHTLLTAKNAASTWWSTGTEHLKWDYFSFGGNPHSLYARRRGFLFAKSVRHFHIAECHARMLFLNSRNDTFAIASFQSDWSINYIFLWVCSQLLNSICSNLNCAQCYVLIDQHTHIYIYSILYCNTNISIRQSKFISKLKRI